MIGTVSIEVNAKNPNMPLWPLRAYVNSPSSLRLVNVPRKIGSWCISAVRLVVVYPDGGVQAAQCVQTGGVWVGTIEGSAVAGTCAQGYTVYADGTDENGNAVAGYILGKGDVAILQANGTPEPEPATVFVKLQEDGTDAEDGDLYPTENGYAIQQDGEAHLLGTPFDQISAYVESAVSAKADLSAIPSNTSQLSNDSGFITSSQVAPYHDPLTPEEDTGIADRAATLAMRDNLGNLDENGGMDTEVTIQSDLTPALRAKLQYATYWDWNLTKFFEQTYSTAVELKFCYSDIRRKVGFPRPYYTGYMWRTAGLDDDGKGYAIPCSEEGIPDGRFIEINEVTTSFISFNNDAMVHTITGNANWTSIETIDEQSGQITCTRTNQYKGQTYIEQLANVSQVPTKTSQLSNDSGFVTSSELDTSLELKQDKLTEDQISAIDFAVNIDSTVVEYLSGEVSSYMIVGGMIPIDIPNIENAVNIKIGKSVTSINQEVFLGCDNLTSITMPNSMTSIGDSSFSRCAGLSSIVIPDFVVSIGYSAFQECTSLNSIVIGENVTTIGGGAFYECANLTNVIFRGKTLSEVQSMQRYPWGISDTSIITTWNDASEEWVTAQGYATTTQLSAKQDQLSEAQLLAIDQDADALLTKFYVQGESQMYSFIASNTLSKSDFAAQGVYDTTSGTWTKNITAVQAGTNVTNLETNLFKDVTTLTFFEGPELRFATGGGQSFAGCTGLQTLIVPKIILLPVLVCKDCTALRNLTIPASLGSIGTVGRNAFQNCSNLQVHFEEKTLAQVQAMLNYPWGLTPSNITASKTATQEWVEEQNYATQTYAVKNDGGVAKIKSLTESQYENLIDKDQTTLYVIPEEV